MWCGNVLLHQSLNEFRQSTITSNSFCCLLLQHPEWKPSDCKCLMTRTLLEECLWIVGKLWCNFSVNSSVFASEQYSARSTGLLRPYGEGIGNSYLVQAFSLRFVALLSVQSTFIGFKIHLDYWSLLVSLTNLVNMWPCATRYRIEQELGTEIKPIPPQIDRGVYCR